MTKGKIPAPADVLNIERTLAAIEENEGLSRISVARILGLSRTTISTIVGKLINLGLVTEKNRKINGRGRPGIVLDLNEAKWRAIGAEFHSGYWSFAETNLKGEITRTFPMPTLCPTPAEFMEALVSGLGEFIRGTEGKLLPALGIGVPGLVDCDRGVILRASDLGWADIHVAETLQAELGYKALLINRNRGSGLAEARYGAGRGVHQMVYIGIGTGISAAFISEGRLIHGSSFSAGEIGHMTIDRNGPLCACGKRGCLHVYASGLAMALRAESLAGRYPDSPLAALSTGGEPLSGETVCAAACTGDPLALDCLRDAAESLGFAIANIVTSFNPDKIILGGPVGRMDSPLLGMTTEVAEKWAVPHAFKATAIERSVLEDQAGALGGACLVLDRKLELAQRARIEEEEC